MRQLKFLIPLLILFFIILFFTVRNNTNDFPKIDYRKNIEDNLALLKSDPENCQLAADTAANYQGLYKLEEAIAFYKQSLRYCPDDIHNRFQLGICYYLAMNREKGIEHMDAAINMAKKASDTKGYEILKEEKEGWLANWDSVKELDWNKK